MVKHAGGALLLSLEILQNTGISMSLQVVNGLKKLMLDRDLLPGERLPSSRTLAKELRISRTTVISAYEQLTAEGMIESRVGSGAFVSQTFDSSRPKLTQEPDFVDQDRRSPRLAELSLEASEHYFPRLSHPETPSGVQYRHSIVRHLSDGALGPAFRQKLA